MTLAFYLSSPTLLSIFLSISSPCFGRAVLVCPKFSPKQRQTRQEMRPRSHLSTPRIIVYLIVYPVQSARCDASWSFPDLRKAQLMLQLPTTNQPTALTTDCTLLRGYFLLEKAGQDKTLRVRLLIRERPVVTHLERPVARE